MRKLLKLLVGLLVVVVVICGVIALWPQFTGHTVQGSVVSAVTGSEKAGKLADEIASSDTVSDSSVASTLGLTSSQYSKVKEVASEAGIDLNDSEQLKSLASKAAGHTSELQSIVSQLESGKISESTAASKVSSLLGLDENK